MCFFARGVRVACALVLAAGVSFCHGQATVAPVERAEASGRPAPAAQRYDAAPEGWWQDAVFYEVFVRSFADSTSGPLANDGVGDLRGLIERLDYLNDGDPETHDDLGVDGIWLMPITDSPSYHGYDTTDYRLVEPDYGTNEDFVALMEACRARGIRVVIDLVLNHLSSDHPWFKAALDGDPAKRDWFIWRDEDPGFRGPWNQPVWHRAPDGAYYYGCFWGGMPDLDYENAEVSAAMLDVVRFWLEDMGVDGFRMDAIRHLIEAGAVQDNTPATHAWLREYFDFVKGVNPEALSIGEVWAGSDDVSRYVGGQMDLAFEFDLAYAIIDSVRDEDSARVVDQLGRMEELYPLGMYATFLRNHDQPRTLHELGGDVEAAKLAASIQFALPGVPFVYYGEEIGMSADKPDPELRTPMQWSGERHAGFSSVRPWKDPKPAYRRVNVAAQTGEVSSVLSHYRRLIDARGAHEVLRTGAVEIEPTSVGSVLAIRRRLGDGLGDGVGDGASVLCLFNLGTRAVRVADAIGYDPSLLRSRGLVLRDLLNPDAGLPSVLGPRAAHYLWIGPPDAETAR
ncbi:MAG: alpha-amylase family glycosyl hydrolase [Planctomycetota bacterium]